MAKIATELNGFDNVIYDLCDEPSLVGKPDGSIAILPDGDVTPWLQGLRQAFLQAEETLPRKHVLGQTVQNLSPDLSGEPWCDWLAAEYVRPAAAALQKDYAVGKPIVNVESDYFGHGLVKPYTVDDVRLEGWWFLIGGGAGTTSLNGEYSRGREAGGPDTRERILPQRKVLKDFMEGFDLDGMTRFEGIAALPPETFASALAEPGRQYAAYLFHARHDSEWGAHFVATPGSYRDAFTLKSVPAGRYRREWVDPVAGQTVVEDVVGWEGGDMTVTTPPYVLDVALRMRLVP